ncbi:hypothetical protein IMSAGC003_02349 [Lachnospiraceae bacterium]|nr:hypothetical protein IMSAGC003_02349 [Lachnospiraceae bacterium]
MEDDLKENIKEDGLNVLYYSQREFDAFIIAKYQKGLMGRTIQQYIINHEPDPEKWYAELGNNGNERRANWMVHEIMFGDGSYISGKTDLTPLYNIYVEGIN